VSQQSNAEDILSDPRGRTEANWLNTLDYLVNLLGESTNCRLHLGTYWCSDDPSAKSASIVGRVRSRDNLPDTSVDYWEAAICYTRNADRAYSTAYAFPFKEGRPLASRGRLPVNGELDEFRFWQLSEGKFIDRGWGCPDGPGEWGWIEKPGDEYWQTVDVQLTSNKFVYGKPIMASLTGVTIPNSHREFQNSQGRISLIHANRNKENTNLYPWGARPARQSCTYSIPIQKTDVTNNAIQIDLTHFRIRGGWVPGDYYVSIRVQNCRDGSDWTYSSDISKPFILTVK